MQVDSKNCSTKCLSDMISKVFEMTFKHVESFHRNVYFIHGLGVLGCRKTSIYWTSKGCGRR